MVLLQAGECSPTRGSETGSVVVPLGKIFPISVGVFVAVKWSACLRSTTSIRDRNPRKPTVVSCVTFVFEKNKKRPGLAHLKKF